MGRTEGARGGREGGSDDVIQGRGEGEKEGGSKVMVGDGTRGGMERRREGESKGRERGSIQYIHTPSRNALLPLLLCYYK